MSLTHGQVERDAGMSAVLAANALWKAKAKAAIIALPAHTEGLFEHFRALVVPLCGEPHHSNAWGGLAGALKVEGVLVDTGRMESSALARSHYRKQPVLRRV